MEMKLPPGVKWLLIINTVFFVLQSFLGGWLESALGLVPAKVLSLEIWRLFTYQFLHGSFIHILFNMLSLWMFGKEIEWSWGAKEFLKFYFTCVLGAGMLNCAVQPFSTVTAIGASGGLYGILVAFAMMFPDTQIYLYAIFPMKAKYFVILIGALEFFASSHGTPSLIARYAHLGGMLTGYLYLKSFEFRSVWTRLLYKISDLFISQAAPQPKPRKEIRPRAKKEDLVKEVDRILEKVLKHGAESLTEQERDVMRRYSATKH
ncbi:MAG: hypothetical protein A2901_04185 [Elusimicrobia bacterium RIFCSPLOWO2_01_FULL_54_10]|nr:MAG: hypothetical protein A2901_04185 [Elusimicrobia bacterium RIFCSPLOWO2_01_FULL_54_10]